MKITKKILDGFEKFMCVFLGIVMIALVTDISIQVVARYVSHNPPTWTEELARRLMNIVVFCGASIAYRKSEMTGITLLIEHIPEKARIACEVVTNLIILGFCIYATPVVYKMCIQTKMQLSPALRIPKWPFYATIGFLFVTTAIFALEKIINQFADFGKEKKE